MKYRSKRILFHLSRLQRRRIYAPAFSLTEVVTALIILALISSSVLVVINRCMVSAADSELRMQAFEVARDNMETLLSKNSVEESVEYGSSIKYPEVKWQTNVEMFYEPTVTEQMQIWVRGICSAEYTDTAGEEQTVELTHWLTSLTKEQLLEMFQQRFSDPNELGEPNRSSGLDTIEIETGTPDTSIFEPEADCDTLPFCESIRCYLQAENPDRPTSDEIIRYLKECP